MVRLLLNLLIKKLVQVYFVLYTYFNYISTNAFAYSQNINMPFAPNCIWTHHFIYLLPLYGSTFSVMQGQNVVGWALQYLVSACQPRDSTICTVLLFVLTFKWALTVGAQWYIKTNFTHVVYKSNMIVSNLHYPFWFNP